MEHIKLTESLTTTADSLAAERVSEIDFVKLTDDLRGAVRLIESLLERSLISDKLLSLLKSELAHKARAIAFLQGRDCHLAEKLLEDGEMSFAALLELKQQIENEFDSVFSQKLTEPTGAAGKGEKRVGLESINSQNKRR
jgi:hypothetical protein